MIEFLAGIAKRVSTLATDYTTARAAKLDNLDAAISAISVIKTMTYGSITMDQVSSNTASLNPAVNPGKAVAIFLGSTCNAAAASTSSRFAKITLTNGTTVTATRDSTNGVTVANFCVVEFK